MFKNMSKKEKQLLLIGGVVGGLILLIMWTSGNKKSSSSNATTPGEFASSWNMSSTWNGPSGQHATRHWNGRPPMSNPIKWDADHDKVISGGFGGTRPPAKKRK